ncbi:hypothetical protein AB1Y20_016238 [Prymnesium parvum]|uniref:Protein kinase domain-containing protein n=1 Tax=Prymnesium parvum TaxID=97485 RepID=A0AB34IDK4_PRYPA
MAGTSQKAAFDCCGPSSQLAVFIGEYKGNGAQGVRAGLTEAFAHARAAAIELFIQGVPWEQIIVPVFSADGCSIQFGAVYHGAPKDGVLCMATSSVLDLTSEYGAMWATAYFKKLEAHVQATQSLVHLAHACQQWDAPPTGTIRIHKSLYLKEGGIASRALGNEADSLMHTMHVFEHLHASNAAPVICFPIGMYHGLRRAVDGKNSFFLAFPNLEEEGYSIYPPVDEEGVKLFISQLRLAVEKVHEAGIVHGDLYVTNILWNGNSVKIIDWDTAFFAEEGVPNALREQWEQNPKWQQYERSEVIEDLDNFLVDTYEYAWNHGQWFSSAQSPSEMKQSFRASQLQLATQKGLIPQDE